MKLTPIFILILFCFTLQVQSQEIVVVPQVNYNYYHVKDAEDPKVYDDLSPEYGYGVRIGSESFRIGFDHYKGLFSYGDHTFENMWRAYYGIDKYLVSLEYMPLDIEFYNFHFLVGAEGAIMVSGNNNGIYQRWGKDIGIRMSPIIDYNSQFSFGPKARLSYDLKLTKRLSIRPQYAFYFGLTNEFQEQPKTAKAIRHYFGLGIACNVQNSLISIKNY